MTHKNPEMSRQVLRAEGRRVLVCRSLRKARGEPAGRVGRWGACSQPCLKRGAGWRLLCKMCILSQLRSKANGAETDCSYWNDNETSLFYGYIPAPPHLLGPPSSQCGCTGVCPFSFSVEMIPPFPGIIVGFDFLLYFIFLQCSDRLSGEKHCYFYF